MDLSPAPLANQTCLLTKKNMVNAKNTHKRRRKNDMAVGIFRKSSKDMMATILSYVSGTDTFSLFQFLEHATCNFLLV